MDLRRFDLGDLLVTEGRKNMDTKGDLVGGEGRCSFAGVGGHPEVRQVSDGDLSISRVGREPAVQVGTHRVEMCLGITFAAERQLGNVPSSVQVDRLDGICG